jgi:ABC-type antimicrobial peptide transport system, ATPase component
MLRFEHFELAPGARLEARIERGKLHVLRLDPEHVNEEFLARYLAGGARRAQGELWLEEVKDAVGKPVALRALGEERLRGFFAKFVGFVLRDGGLLDELTVRENLVLSRRYHDVWPRRAKAEAEEMAALLGELTRGDEAGVAAPELLERCPAELNLFARRYWGFVATLLRRPQLVIAFAPFEGLRAADQAAIAALMRRYRKLEPACALLLVVSGAEARSVLATEEVVELRAGEEEFSA